MFNKMLEYLFSYGFLFFKTNEVKANETNQLVVSEHPTQEEYLLKSKALAIQLKAKLKEYDSSVLDDNPFSSKLLLDIETKFNSFGSVYRLLSLCEDCINLQLSKPGNDFYLNKFQVEYTPLVEKTISIGVFITINESQGSINSIKVAFDVLIDKIDYFLTILMRLFNHSNIYESKQIYFSLQLENFLVELGKLVESIYSVGVDIHERKEEVF